MAMAGVLGPGRDASGRVCLKAWGERDHHSVILRQSDEAGMDFFAFKVDSDATLDKLEKDLQSWGLKTERLSAGELLETGERMRFEIFRGGNSSHPDLLPIERNWEGLGEGGAVAISAPVISLRKSFQYGRADRMKGDRKNKVQHFISTRKACALRRTLAHVG